MIIHMSQRELANPRRRLLIVSKKCLFVEMFVVRVSHGAPPCGWMFRRRHSSLRKVHSIVTQVVRSYSDSTFLQQPTSR